MLTLAHPRMGTLLHGCEAIGSIPYDQVCPAGNVTQNSNGVVNIIASE